MRVGKWVSFIGSTAALAAMTVRRGGAVVALPNSLKSRGLPCSKCANSLS